MKSLNEDMRPLTLRLSETQGATFAAARDAVRMKLGELTVTGIVWRFIERLDAESPLLPATNCFEMPVAFHASLQCSADLLRVYHARGMKYEGDETLQFNPRAIIQHYARLYGVEPDAVADFYPVARAWLAHRQLQHPFTLDALINNVKLKQIRKLN